MDIVIANGKGGCGKTTVAVHLATALAHRIKTDVVLVDHDPQRSASDWCATRNKATFHRALLPITAQKWNPSETHQGFIRIHDMAAGSMPLAEDANRLSNALLLIPVLPGAIDIKALFRYTMKVNRLGGFEGYQRVALIANRMRPKCESSDLLMRFIDAQDFALSTRIHHSEHFVRAMSTGVTCFDHPLKANAILREQFAPLIDLVHQHLVCHAA